MGKWIVALVVLIAVFGGIFGGKWYQDQQAAQAAAEYRYPPTAVDSTQARKASWDSLISTVGTLRARTGTQITAQIAGNITRIDFESGQRVNAGDLLVQLDNSSQLAALQADQARLQLANADLERAQKLIKSSTVSQEQVQTAQMNRDVAAAAVESDKAALNKLRITAPFAGVLGIREVDLGQYISPGTTIVTLQQWSPLLLDFSLPQENLAQLQSGQAISFATNAHPGEIFAGKITAIAPQLDSDTRMVQVQAQLDNADEKLRPGLFGHVSLNLGSPLEGIVVPQTAITYSTFGNSVYVVADGEQGGQVAQARMIQVLLERDGQVLLAAENLQPGDEVVTNGQHKIWNGAFIRTSNPDQPQAGGVDGSAP